MKNTKVEIKNFRSIKDAEVISFDDFTALVGKNDIGKSTILEALDIFFNDGNGAVKIERSDLNVYSLQEGDDTSEIAVTFDDLPKSILIDAAVSTTLQDEFLLNPEGKLEIVKRYRNGSNKPAVFIRANHPTNKDCMDLLIMKNNELKKIIEQNNIECNNKSVNSVMRSAIWQHYSDKLMLEPIEIDASKADAKAIWEKLSHSMPVFSLFQADRQNSDSDSEVQDPLQEAVKQIISDANVQKKLAEIASIVEDRLTDVSNRTLSKVKEMDAEVANSLKPDIPSVDRLKWEAVFKNVSITGDDRIPINKRGSGVKRLILLNFFRADAERRAEEGDTEGVIYAIEKPETSQHFSNQRLLATALKDLASKGKAQIIITTHSPVIVKELDYCNIRMIYEDDDGKHITPIKEAVLKYPSMNEINFLYDRKYRWRKLNDFQEEESGNSKMRMLKQGIRWSYSFRK